jgi:hypothetical protein
MARTSHGYHVDAGLDVQISHLVRGEVFIGYLEQHFNQSVAKPLPNVAGLDFGAQLDWYVDQRVTLHISGSRQLSDVVLAGTSVADTKGATVSADYEFRPNIILQARASYSESRFIGSTRTDVYPGAGIGVKYLVNNYVSANLNYNYSQRAASVAASKYQDNTISLGLSFHI